MIPLTDIKLPLRSRKYGVGKEIGGAVYVHRDYSTLLGPDVVNAAAFLPEGFLYAVVKLREAARVVTFIECSDFNTADEPTVGQTCTIYADGRCIVRRRLADPYIYHHKWLFVADDYCGFDVNKSKERTRAWTALPNIDRNRIGRRGYWERMVIPLLAPESD